jgi:16S rRNA A1518/A1519 N6-dimethyltransferase RsmA/KsgA/DIM1 with predicted DNA glycosylase/AP lyase activity
MYVVFDKGNSILNGFVKKLISVQADDHILEIGFGIGKLIHYLAKDIHKGYIEGIEF